MQRAITILTLLVKDCPRGLVLDEEVLILVANLSCLDPPSA
jgi:hypothetical protein